MQSPRKAMPCRVSTQLLRPPELCLICHGVSKADSHCAAVGLRPPMCNNNNPSPHPALQELGLAASHCQAPDI